MTSNHEQLLERLNNAESHPDIRQTHISVVCLTRDFAYKRLKPVEFDFLDYSTREARYLHLANEARLNRRLTTEVYRGLVPLWREQNQWRLSGDGPPEDWLLEMRRLPEEANLEVIIRDGRFVEETIDRAVERLAAYFAKADLSEAISANGSSWVLRQNLTENHRVIEQGGSEGVVELDSVRRLRSCQLQSLIRLDEELRERAASGWVRDGHGDLRCEHIYLTEQVQIVDCIAFNHRLRWIDLADDISFLATDLIRLGADDGARRLVDLYRSASTDPVSDQLLSFYRSYRYAVRAKVHLLRLRDTLDDLEKRSKICEARKFIELAIRELAWNQPWLIVVCGLSGTGKTSLGRILAEHLGAIQLSSDLIRKDLAGLETRERGDAALYSAEMRRRTYDELHTRAELLLQSGTGTVLDATYINRSDRDALRCLADRVGTTPLFVECRCDEAEIARRLHERTLKGNDASDATLDVWKSQHTISDGYAELPRYRHLVVDTSETQDRLLDEIVSRLKGR